MRDKYIDGTIWRYDYLDTLTYEEYLWWIWHVLPFGWQVISTPKVVGEKK